MLYINVPFSEKDEAKRLGAKWDPEKRSWYVQQRKDYYKFYKWILGAEYEKSILCDCYYIIEGMRTCYKCQKKTTVICFGAEKYCDIYDPEEYEQIYSWWNGEIHTTSFIDLADEEMLSYLSKKYGYCMGYSRTAEESYLANHCQHCGALQGHFHVYEEVDSPFFIDSIEKAKGLNLYRVKLDNDVVTDLDMNWGSEDHLIKEYANFKGDFTMN